jgi:hypothetical protein
MSDDMPILIARWVSLMGAVIAVGLINCFVKSRHQRTIGVIAATIALTGIALPLIVAWVKLAIFALSSAEIVERWVG